jgi:hypothetical protein
METQRTTPEQRAEIVTKFRQSGLTQRAFAESAGIRLAQLKGWLYPKTYSTKASCRPRFVRVQTPSVGAIAGDAKLQMDLVNGVVLRFGCLPEPEYLARLHRALSAC